MFTCPLVKFLRAALLVILAQFALVIVAQAQFVSTLRGRVVYSTGEAAAGARVDLTKTVQFAYPPTITTESAIADSGGNYSFQAEGRCGPIDYQVQAFSSEIVDDDSLPPSNSSFVGSCVGEPYTFPDLIIEKPHLITLGGYITDQFGNPVQRLTVTMTRTKYDLNPNVVTTATTTTDGSGHYQFSTYSRCTVEEVFRASIGNYVFPEGTSVSGCVLGSVDILNFSITLGAPTPTPLPTPTPTASPTPTPTPPTAPNLGESCPNQMVGKPVNVTNGNVFLKQADYTLPGRGEAISFVRAYNSMASRSGIFGKGWSTAYDESLLISSANSLRLFTPDGKGTDFAGDGSGSFSPVQTDFFGQINQTIDGSFSLSFKDGRVHVFNSSGRLLSLVDRSGNRTSLTYDGNGRLMSINDPSGRSVSVTSDASGFVRSMSDSLGLIATYSYSTDSKLAQVIYADGSGFTFTYDGNNRLTRVFDALGNLLESHDYDSQGRAITSERQSGVERYSLSYVSNSETDVTDALGHVTRYFFDTTKSRNVVTRIEGLCSCGSGSQSQTWTYDNNLNVLSSTNGLNQVTAYTYDSQGNQLTMTDAAGTTTSTYNQFGELLSVTDALGGTTSITYNDQGSPVSITDPLNHTTSYTSDSRGQLLSVTDARGKTTSFSYDNNGNLLTSTDALNQTTQRAYDVRGRLISTTNALGNVTSFAYDGVGRLTQVTRSDGSATNYEYDPVGRLSAVIDPKGNRATYVYDGTYRLTSMTDARSQTTSYSYDAMSNVSSVTDLLSRTTNYEYDDFNRLVKVSYPPVTNGAARLFQTLTYDAVGNVTQRTDTAGRATNFTYDNANRLVAITDPLSQVTRYEYDARSNLTALVDALGQRYTFAYDPLSRVTAMNRAGMTMSFAYDAVGNRIQRNDYNNLRTSYDYDALNRLTKISYPDATNATYGYDKLSRLTDATNINGTVSFVYDKLGRVTSTTDVWGQLIDYTYDPNGNRTKMSTGGMTAALYEYDALNRPTTVTDGAGLAVNYAYDATGKLISRALPNGVQTTYSYDGLDRLTRLQAVGTKVVTDNAYQYNDAGDLVQNTDLGGPHTYAYDALDRLTSATYPKTTNESYSYDAIGNRANSQRSSTYNYQPFNRLVGTSTAKYAFDNNGNLTTRTENGKSTNFGWDFENRLTQVVTPASGSVSYKYDALGRRIQRTGSDGAATNFTHDGQDVLKDVNNDGSTVDYLNGPGIDNKVRQTSNVRKKSTALYFATDHLGSTTALTNDKGHVVDEITYDAFGNGAGSKETRYDYTGRERDPLTGLMFYRARWYDPQIGRFISEDPIGLAGGINQFAYVGNSPQNAKDPSGLYEIDVHYYLTYFIASKFSCLTKDEARLIADADQSTDENSGTSPELGLMLFPDPVTGVSVVPDILAQYKNETYHGLHLGSHQPYLDNLWHAALRGNGNYVGLGQYLHYVQDMFSHAGYTNSVYGHLFGTHWPDKTASDVGKAAQMVSATWFAIRDWVKAKNCNCGDPGDTNVGDWWPQVMDFLSASGGPFRREINAEELERKRQILGVPVR